jgi:putative ABC transport system permease protein
MKIPFSYTYRNLWTRKATAVLTIGGIGLVVFVFAAVLMLAQGIRDTLVATGREDNVMILRKTATSEIMSSLSRESSAIVGSLPEIARKEGEPFASNEMSVIINLLKIGSNDMGNVIVRGVEPNAFALRPQVKLSSGRLFKEGMSEIIVGSSIHTRFNGCEVGQRLKFGGREWTIVGVFDGQKSGFDSEIWGDVEQLVPAFGRPVFSTMIARLTDKASFDVLKTRFEADPRLQQLEPKIEQAFFAEQSEMMSQFISVLGLVITIIFSFGAVIGAMITMYAAVANRTTEIGTLRAIGFRRRNVLFSFLIEAILISLLGGAVGLLLASTLQFFSVSTVNWGSFSELAFGFSLTAEITISTLVFALVMGIVGGVLPAVRASRMKIVNALRAA